jgi:hypothetical protein
MQENGKTEGRKQERGKFKLALKHCTVDAFIFCTYCIGSDCGVLQPVTFITNEKIKLNLRDVIIITNKHFI